MTRQWPPMQRAKLHDRTDTHRHFPEVIMQSWPDELHFCRKHACTCALTRTLSLCNIYIYLSLSLSLSRSVSLYAFHLQDRSACGSQGDISRLASSSFKRCMNMHDHAAQDRPGQAQAALDYISRVAASRSQVLFGRQQLIVAVSLDNRKTSRLHSSAMAACENGIGNPTN